MAALAGGEVRDHQLEVVAALQEHEPAVATELTAAIGDELGELVTDDHAVAGDERRRRVVVAPGSRQDVDRHCHGRQP